MALVSSYKFGYLLFFFNVSSTVGDDLVRKTEYVTNVLGIHMLINHGMNSSF